jgi:site-specific DNA recombinase
MTTTTDLQGWGWKRFVEHYQQIEAATQLDTVRPGHILRVAPYARVSTEEQISGYSIQEQIIAAKEYAAKHGWKVIDTYIDEGYTGTNSKRPAFRRLRRDVQRRRIDVVVVQKLDRFYRNAQGMFNVYEEFDRQGVLFTSLSEKIDFARPEGKLILAVLSTLAEIYITNLREDTRKGKKGRARRGLWNGSIPFGYCRGNCSSCTDNNGPGYCPEYGQPDRSHDPDIMVPHPIESQAVQYAFAQYATGQYSDRDIAALLNEYTVVLPDGTTRAARTKGRNYDQTDKEETQ